MMQANPERHADDVKAVHFFADAPRTATFRPLSAVEPSMTVYQDRAIGPHSPEETLAQLSTLLKNATSATSAGEALASADRIADGNSTLPGVRLTLLRLRDKANVTGLTAQWAALQRDHPNDGKILRAYVRHLAREEGVESALATLSRCLPGIDAEPKASLLRAEILADLHLHQESTALFQELLQRDGRREVRVAFAKRLRKQGLIVDAVEVIRPAMDTLAPGSMAAALAATLIDDYEFYRALEPGAMVSGHDVKLLSMKHALLHFRGRDIRISPDNRHTVALVTGSLGAGGAERQLSRLACQLKTLSRTAPGTGDVGCADVDSVEVLVKQHSSRQEFGNEQPLDFFLETLVNMEVAVKEISLLPPVQALHQPISDATLLRLLEQLPPQVHYGVTRLTPYLRERGFDVVSLWQDGTCLFGALAALLAGVPVIQLVFRGLPPNIRRMRYRPEYQVLYRALAEVPGVVFVSNSKAAADEYAKWLELPRDRFEILYNGVPDVPISSETQDETKWAEFAQGTSDATETIGGVFRLEPDKRPLLWIRMMHRYLIRHPKARFFIVGNGRLWDQTHELAKTLGVDHRLLLVGHSMHVGFWYSKMDAKVLLSSFEGLPNVLIEAQLMGVGTVSTPAGGSGECFIDGQTGHLLSSVEEPDLDEACDRISQILNCRKDANLAAQSKGRALALFSVDAMVERFLSLCKTPAGRRAAGGERRFDRLSKAA